MKQVQSENIGEWVILCPECGGNRMTPGNANTDEGCPGQVIIFTCESCGDLSYMQICWHKGYCHFGWL